MLSKETKQNLILSLLGIEDKGATDPVTLSFVGRKVMVRTYSAGVHFGILVEKVGQQAILKDSRRVHYWTKAASLSQLSQEGSKDLSGCRIAMTIPEIMLDRVIEVIPMGDLAISTLYGAAEWKNS